jgi:DNA-binding NarL/FixJ family response regulator
MKNGRETHNGGIRVLIVDPQPVYRQGLCDIISTTKDITVTGQSGDPQQALGMLKALPADVAVVDFGTTEAGGMSLIGDICKWFPLVRILVLSIYEELTFAEQMLRAGAHGYVAKCAQPGEILDAIRRVYRGEICLSDAMQQGIVRQSIQGSPTRTRTPVECLSEREFEVFRRLGQGLATCQIAGRLFISVKTVESHYEHIRRKLDIDCSRTLLLRAVEWLRLSKA